jgi:hypothetical protein
VLSYKTRHFERLEIMTAFRCRNSILCLLLAGIAVGALCSCASKKKDEDLPLSEKLEERNLSYASYSERRRMRLEARQQRTDMWFKRVMGVD